MDITSNPLKKAKTFADCGLSFDNATLVFAGAVYTFEDTRKDYGECRMISIGLLDGRMVVVGWTPRGNARHVFSMRKANEREQQKYRPLLAPE